MLNPFVQEVSAQSFDYIDIMLQSADAGEYKEATLGSFISQYLPWVYGIATLLLLVTFVIAGLRIAVGGKKALESMRKTLIWAIVGYAVIMVASLIVQMVSSFFEGAPAVFGS